MIKDHWDLFNWGNILVEAKLRLAVAQAQAALGEHRPDYLTTEMETLEYWCAWVAHANVASAFRHNEENT